MENKECSMCGSKLSKVNHYPVFDIEQKENLEFCCRECYDKSVEYVENNGLPKDWNIIGLIFIMGIFGWNGKEVSIEKLKEIFCKKDKDND